MGKRKESQTERKKRVARNRREAMLPPVQREMLKFAAPLSGTPVVPTALPPETRSVAPPPPAIPGARPGPPRR